MNRYHFSFALIIFIAFSSPIYASSNDTEQLYLADASDFFNSFKKDVGKAFNDLKDVATGNAERRDGSQTEESTETTNQPSTVQSSSSNTLTREENREIQKLLTDAGYNPGPADGYPGNKTKSSIKEFQNKNGMKVDGQPSKSLLAKLRSSVPETQRYSPKEKMKVVVTAEQINDGNKNVASAKAEEQKVSNNTNKHTPFGIPLGAKYSSGQFKRVYREGRRVSSRKGRDLSAIVNPSKPHPIFNHYQIEITDGFISEIKGKFANVRQETTGKGITFRNTSDCVDTIKSIANSLQNKYGQGKRSDRRNDLKLYINNPNVNVKFIARCHSTHPSTQSTFKLTFKDAIWLKQQNNLKSKQAESDRRKVTKGNDVF